MLKAAAELKQSEDSDARYGRDSQRKNRVSDSDRSSLSSWDQGEFLHDGVDGVWNLWDYDTGCSTMEQPTSIHGSRVKPSSLIQTSRRIFGANDRGQPIPCRPFL